MKLTKRNVSLPVLCALALSACGTSSPVLRPDPPKVELPPLPADKMAKPNFGERARKRFLTTSPKPTKQTAGSAGSKPN